MDMRDQKFGIEIEMTGITRKMAASVIAAYFSKQAQHVGGAYDEYMVRDTSNRKWKVVSDSSIIAQRKDGAMQIENIRWNLCLLSVSMQISR